MNHWKQPMLVLLCISTSFAPRLRAQQAKAAPAVKQDNEVHFVALEEYEKRGKVLKIREKMMAEREEKARRDTFLQGAAASLQLIPQQYAPDEQLVQYIGLRRSLLEELDSLGDTANRQVELAGLLDTAMAAGGLLPQVADYLKESRQQLQNMNVSQTKAQKQITEMLQTVKLAIQNVPPPASFKNESGMTMRLIRGGKNAFYISGQPVAVGINWQEAQELARKTTHRENAIYALPGQEQLSVLEQRKIFPEQPIWTARQWTPEENGEEQMLERFGVQEYLVWNPKGVLGARKSFGELPFARYPQMAVYLVTSSRTGWNVRWKSIMQKMANQPAGKEEQK
ncbi:MAG: hypothetical protein IJJ33_02460 [Victivallales bacterium]|nr:hypothetical protein [Victivallales bacterium]